MTVECAVGRVKGHWWCLLTRMDLNEKNIPIVIAPSCDLNNICEAMGEKAVTRIEGGDRADFEQPYNNHYKNSIWSYAVK